MNCSHYIVYDFPNSNDHQGHIQSSIIMKGGRGPLGVGYKLTSNGNDDIENKELKNIKDGTGDRDVVSKKWIQDHVTSRQGQDLAPYLKKDGSV